METENKIELLKERIKLLKEILKLEEEISEQAKASLDQLSRQPCAPPNLHDIES